MVFSNKWIITMFFIMAKKSMIERQRKRIKLVKKYSQKRLNIKKTIHESTNLEASFAFRFEFQKLPRNSSPTRLNNRCSVTGRPQGYYRDFGLSRHVLREMGHQCLLPGLRKSSW